MKIITLLPLVFILSGCVNVYKYAENQKPLETFTTQKNAIDVQECILSKWQQEPMGYPITSQKIGDRYSVLATIDNVDVVTKGKYTLVSFYSLRGYLDPFNGINKRKRAIKYCL